MLMAKPALKWSLSPGSRQVAGTITVAHNRVSVNGRAMDGQPKTDRSARTLPLTPVLATALRRALAGQKAERLALGRDYGPGEHVVCDEAGRPYHPDTISDYWRALCTAAKVPSIRLHDARHTCGTLMHLQGVPIVVISAWLGHARSGVHHADLRPFAGRRAEARRREFATTWHTLGTLSVGP